MKVYEYFIKHKDNNSRIRELSYKYEKIENSLMNPRGVSWSNMPIVKGNADNSPLLKIMEKDEILEKIKSLKEENRKLEEQYEKDIEKLDNLRYRTVIRMFYIDESEVEDIEKELRITPNSNHLYKIKRNAEYIFEKIINDTK